MIRSSESKDRLMGAIFGRLDEEVLAERYLHDPAFHAGVHHLVELVDLVLDGLKARPEVEIKK